MTRDSRPPLRAVQREYRAIKEEIEAGSHERFQVGYLMGMSVALLWMTEKECAPPTAMFDALREMLHERARRRR